MYKMLVLFMGLLSVLAAEVSPVSDPYEKIDYFVLDNGMQVYLLSNKKATNTNISMTINVGWDIEDKDNYGLSHLVEHMVFRDKRVPHRDYLDYMKEEGASYVNGFTSRYETKLVTKIDSNKSYWIAKTFATMIFDKDVDMKDIDVEKGAVQVEIGEKAWYDYFGSKLAKIKVLFPPRETLYESHFGLKKPKELPSAYVEKVNNKKFTLQKVMSHYKKYYYPSNMILKITGNFDTQKMKSLVIADYGKIDTKGTARTHKPPRDAILSHRPYIYHREGLGTNYGYIGAQYLFDDCRKHIILNAFTSYVAKKLQQKLRNKDGKSYTVSTSNLQSRGAGIVSVAFDGLHTDFETNIALAEKTLQYYVTDLNDSMIEEALSEYEKRYTSIEFDSDSLSSLVNKAEHMRTDHKIENTTHYGFFKNITPAVFKKVVSEVFVPENKYMVIYRDYYRFTGDTSILNFLIFILILFIYFRFSHFIFKARGVDYKKRDVIFSDRVANRFAGVMVFIFIVFLSASMYAWGEYIVMKYIMNDANYAFTLDMPYSFYMDMLNNVLSTVCMFLVFRWLVTYHSRIDVTSDRLYILGSKPMMINKEEVLSMDVVPWHLRRFFEIIGFSFFFWRPLLRVKTKEKTYYIRSSHANALQENLTTRWMDRT